MSLSNTIEKSTVTFSCHTQFLNIEKTIIWPFSRSKKQNGQLPVNYASEFVKQVCLISYRFSSF